MSTTAVIDLDFVKHAVACAGEKRSIIATHKSTGNTKEFSNRTEFWGRGKKGGWLEELNKSRDSPFTPDEFEVEDVQTPEPIANVLHSAKSMTKSLQGICKADKVKYFIGEGESFRVERSTLLKYKGNRDNLIKPVLMPEVVEYLKKTFKPEVITRLEVDDVIVMEAYNKPDHFCYVIDKDAYGQPTKVFNHNRPEEGVVDCTGLGKLWMDGKKVRGAGVMFLLFQCCSQDSVDNFKANCMSDKKWGEKSAYKALHEATSYKDAFTRAVAVFKELYPEPKTITGWRGEEIEIDWSYVFQEMFDMARMLRWEGDDVKVLDVLDKLGVEYEG